jgi:hypothetical protein
MRLLILFSLAIHAACEEAAVVQKTWTLHHSTAPNQWEARGRIRLEVQDEKAKLNVENFEVTTDKVSSILEMEFYQLKLVDDSSSSAVVTTVPACLLRRANFR